MLLSRSLSAQSKSVLHKIKLIAFVLSDLRLCINNLIYSIFPKVFLFHSKQSPHFLCLLILLHAYISAIFCLWNRIYAFLWTWFRVSVSPMFLTLLYAPLNHEHREFTMYFSDFVENSLSPIFRVRELKKPWETHILKETFFFALVEVKVRKKDIYWNVCYCSRITVFGHGTDKSRLSTNKPRTHWNVGLF
jgi:hypothetical protein